MECVEVETKQKPTKTAKLSNVQKKRADKRKKSGRKRKKEDKEAGTKLNEWILKEVKGSKLGGKSIAYLGNIRHTYCMLLLVFNDQLLITKMTSKIIKLFNCEKEQ